MEPIVSPWFVYLIGVTDGIRAGFVVICILVGIALGILTVVKTAHQSEQESRVVIKPVLQYLAMMLFLIMLCNVIPDRNTVIGMAVAKNITSDRVVKAGKVVYAAKEDIKKDVIDIILALKKEDPTNANTPKKTGK